MDEEKLKKKQIMNSERKNINRGYMKLRVWRIAVDYYRETCAVFLDFPYALKRISSNQIASVDSIQRNISEGYCRRTIKEYLNFLTIAKGSLGESISSLHTYLCAEQLNNRQFQHLDSIAYELENGLINLMKSLEKKDNWSETIG